MQNRVTHVLADALILAAEQVGEDNRGRNGIVGYLCRMARTEPKLFFWLLARLALAQTESKGDDKLLLDKPYETVEEAREACRLLGMTSATLRQAADEWEEEERARSANADSVEMQEPGTVIKRFRRH